MADQFPLRVGAPERRLKFISLKLDYSSQRCTATVTLEREQGRRIVCKCPGTASAGGVRLSAASATAAALGEAIDVGPDAFQVVDIKKVKVFHDHAVVVAISVRSEKRKINLVGFGIIDPKKPARGGVIAVLNGTNRYVSAYLSPRKPRKGKRVATRSRVRVAQRHAFEVR